MAANDYAVVVGITHYPGISDLQGPENDARHFHEWLVAADGGAVPEKQVALILSSAYPDPTCRQAARPIIEDINQTFENLIEQGNNNNGRVGRRLYIFLAGHGFSPSFEEAALLMANSGEMFLGYHLPGRSYTQWFITSALFEEVVLFMDCCRDNYLGVPLYTPPWSPAPSAGGFKVRYLLGFATKWSRESREKVVDGEVQGLFTWSLLKALRGDVLDEQGQVTAGTLKGSVYRSLQQLLSGSEYEEPLFEGDDDLVFAQGLPLPQTTVQITFGQLDQNAPVKLSDSSFKTLGQHIPKDGPWEIALHPDFYQLSVPTSGQGQIFEVVGKDTVCLHGQSQLFQIAVKDAVKVLS